MTTQIELTKDLKADLVDHMGTELSIVNAARVSFNETSEELTPKDEGLIRFLMKNRHASPFEHCTITFRIEAPIFVAREWHRHRTQAYNEWSGRYSVLEPKFYLPAIDRPVIQKGKPGNYYFEVAPHHRINTEIDRELRLVYQAAWDCYEYLLDDVNVAKEVARMCLPVAVYTSWYATASLRNWLNFLSLRAEEHALYEIRQLAYRVEEKLYKLYPITLTEWDKSGRGPV